MSSCRYLPGESKDMLKGMSEYMLKCMSKDMLEYVGRYIGSDRKNNISECERKTNKI